MNRLDLNKTGGLPLSTQILDGMQQAYLTANKFGLLAGDLVVITGCVDSGTAISDGYVIINGELLFFKGTSKTENVVIQEIAEDPRGFEDGSAKPVIYTRYATMGAGTETFPWASFRRPMNMLQMEDEILKLKKTVPVGLVAIWGRPAEEIPEGWVEHTDMQGYTPVGQKPGDTNFATLDTVVGAAQVTLTTDNLPTHSHRLFGNNGQPNTPLTTNPTATVGWDGNQGGEATYRTAPAQSPSAEATNGKTSSVGSNLPHSNIQPSRIVKFIRFVGF